MFPYSTTGTPPPTLNPNFSAIPLAEVGRSLVVRRTPSWGDQEAKPGLPISGILHLVENHRRQLDRRCADSFNNSFSSLHWYDLRLNKSLADFNTPRVLVASVTWDLPKPKMSSVVGEKVLGGWEMGAIFIAHDGQPFSELLSGDVVGQNSSDPFSFSELLTGPGCNTLVNPGNGDNYVKTQCFSVPTAPTHAFYNTYCNPATPFPTCANLLGNARRAISSPVQATRISTSRSTRTHELPSEWTRNSAPSFSMC